MTTDANRERVRGYLESQAEKYDLVDLWPRVMAQRFALLGMLDGVTEEQARWRPPVPEGKTAADEEAWSILEIVQHLTTWTDNVADLVRSFAGGEPATKLPMGYLDADPGKRLAQARRELTEASMRFSEMMAIDESTFRPGATEEHALFGPLNARQWLLFQRIHDTDHISGLEQLKQAPGFPTSEVRAASER